MINIEKPTIKDKEKIFDLYKKTWIDTYVSDTFAISKSDIEEFFSNITPDLIKIKNIDDKIIRIVAREGSDIVGFLEAFILEDNPLNGYIRTLYVDPTHQRKGMGGSMLSYVKDTFKEVKSLTLETAVFNKKGIDFYIKNGFQIDPTFDEVFKIKEDKVIPLVKLQLNIIR